MKNKPTLGEYMIAGARLRLLKELAVKAMADKCTNISEYNKMSFAMIAFHEACSKQEGRMFAEYPDLTDDYCKVFYGNLFDELPKNEINDKVIDLAMDIVKSLFTTKTWDKKFKEEK